MSGWLPDGTAEWQGRPVARLVADAEVRHRARISGVVRGVVVRRQCSGDGPVHPFAHGGALDATLCDGTGTITLRWLGREAIPGIAVGASLEVEGTVSRSSGGLVLLDPLYRFVVPRDAAVAHSDPSTSW